MDGEIYTRGISVFFFLGNARIGTWVQHLRVKVSRTVKSTHI